VGGSEPDAQPAFTAEVGPFYISKAPLTNLQYEVFRADHVRAPHGAGDDDPAVGVTFHDAQAYCDWYSERTGKPFRLPTELEWEHAAKAETDRPVWFGDATDAERFVWHAGNSDGALHPIERKRANPFGLFEMLGTVWEWTSSKYRPYPAIEGDGREVPGGDEPRVLRGGSFRCSLDGLTCSVRKSMTPGACLDDVGFRIVRSL
jgi:formylglycine-generating enzyme required for sulfatase activity